MDKVVHFEVPADDVARAQKFYTEVFGWQIKKFDMPGMEYYGVHTVATDEKGMPQEMGGINGGMMKRSHPEEQPVLVINVKDLDATVAKATSMGAKVVMPKMPIADMGLYARIVDTEGNVIGVWQDLKKM